MNKHTVLESMALSAAAYNPGQPRPSQGSQRFHSAPNGVQFFVRTVGQEVHIIFRGSNSPLDWAHNLAFAKLEVPGFCSDAGVRVHRGFLWGYAGDGVRDVIHAQAGHGARILVSGHSYGAALATLCALDLALAFPAKAVEAHLFGSPRVGNKAFMRCYDRHVIQTIRVECGNDVVTKLPLALMGYRHVGSRFHVGRPRLPLVLSREDHYPRSYYRGLLGKLLP